MYIPCDYKRVEPKVMEQIKAEEKLEQIPQRKMNICTRVKDKDIDEVSETNAAFQMKINSFDNLFHPSSPRDIKKVQGLKAKGHRFWSISEGQLERWQERYRLKCHCKFCKLFCDIYYEQSHLSDEDPDKEYQGMAIFGCDFLQFLNRHVVLPEKLD